MGFEKFSFLTKRTFFSSKPWKIYYRNRWGSCAWSLQFINRVLINCKKSWYNKAGTENRTFFVHAHHCDSRVSVYGNIFRFKRKAANYTKKGSILLVINSNTVRLSAKIQLFRFWYVCDNKKLVLLP